MGVYVYESTSSPYDDQHSSIHPSVRPTEESGTRSFWFTRHGKTKVIHVGLFDDCTETDLLPLVPHMI